MCQSQAAWFTEARKWSRDQCQSGQASGPAKTQDLTSGTPQAIREQAPPTPRWTPASPVDAALYLPCPWSLD